jgi:NADH-quinone oxidoreductase subunit N
MEDFFPYISSSINDTMGSLGYFQAEITLVTGFLVVILADLFFSKRNAQLCFGLTFVTIVSVGFLNFNFLHTAPVKLFGGMVSLDHLSALFKLLFCFVSILFVLFVRYNKALQSNLKGTGDLYSILLAVHLGLNLMVMSANLLMVFISLEMVSVGSYLMVGYLSGSAKQSEASMKYALFGAVCSAIMLYGISLLYSFTGTLDLYDPMFLRGLQNVPAFPVVLALSMVLIGVAFKLSLVPFHFWSPDVYEGAPTPVTAFLSTGPKIAGFALLIRFIEVFQPAGFNSFNSPLFSLSTILAIMAIFSMIVGNFGAIWQNNVKRMLAYSSIGHTGFMLMALFIFSASGLKALIFYMAVYIIMNMAAFMIVDEVEETTGKENIDQYKGLGKQLSLLMIGMVIVLVSLTGLPPTAGFTAKFLVFSTALEAYNLFSSPLLMAVIITGAISTLVSLFYYFRIPLNAFLRNDSGPDLEISSSPKTYISMFLVLLLLLLILFPSTIMKFI